MSMSEHMKIRKYRYFVGDFETTVYDGQTSTEVWASASVEMFTENVNIFHSIAEQFEYFLSLDANIICYYHNLKFDGSFWMSYLLVTLGYEQAIMEIDENTVQFLPIKEMKNRTFSYSISDMGQWYRFTIKVNNHIIEFRDSLKLLPFSVKRIGQSFGTKHKKLEMEYKGFRYAGCVISEEEKQYIRNDILVIKEALEIMFTEGHNKLTIGSCCLAEYKKILGHNKYEQYFPDLYQIPIDEIHGAKTAGEWIRKSYRGGWCYVTRGKEKRIFENGTTADVNSLYPSMMSSESGNTYPVGLPVFWLGNYIPQEALVPNKYYFIRIRTKFYLKPGHLPFVQIKNTLIYKPREMLETSDVYNHKDGKYYDTYIDTKGQLKEAYVTLTLTCTDYRLFCEHYNLVDCEILDGCYFDAVLGLYDEYMEKYKKIKMESKGAKRELAKLFLNNLYGKMAASTDSSFKVAYVKPDASVGFRTITAHDKKPGYIPCGSAITSYARNFTIRAAQENYHGPNAPGFIYADTDSMHLDLPPEEIRGIKIHDKNFCCWKLESEWNKAIFTRPKTYIEHITKEDGEQLETAYYSVKCAGMPERCKELFVMSLEGKTDEEITDEREKEFLQTKRTLKDFDIGLQIPGKLIPKRIPGGTLLVETPYTMR